MWHSSSSHTQQKRQVYEHVFWKIIQQQICCTSKQKRQTQICHLNCIPCERSLKPLPCFDWSATVNSKFACLHQCVQQWQEQTENKSGEENLRAPMEPDLCLHSRPPEGFPQPHAGADCVGPAQVTWGGQHLHGRGTAHPSILLSIRCVSITWDHRFHRSWSSWKRPCLTISPTGIPSKLTMSRPSRCPAPLLSCPDDTHSRTPLERSCSVSVSLWRPGAVWICASAVSHVCLSSLKEKEKSLTRMSMFMSAHTILPVLSRDVWTWVCCVHIFVCVCVFMNV